VLWAQIADRIGWALAFGKGGSPWRTLIEQRNWASFEEAGRRMRDTIRSNHYSANGLKRVRSASFPQSGDWRMTCTGAGDAGQTSMLKRSPALIS